MRRFLLLILVLWLTADKAPATEAYVAGKPTWEAVGRVNMKGTGFCTGSLIAPNVVLTAAHCMYDKKTGRQVAVKDIEFMAGWQNGASIATRTARQVIVHPDFQYLSNRRLDRVASDIALIELDRPIVDARIQPFSRASRPRTGQEVQVVSYSKEHAGEPAFHETCNVLGRDPSVLVLSCQVSFGASGSPIFIVENGEMRIASVVSAKAEWRNRDVALGVSLGETLDDLLNRLASNPTASLTTGSTLARSTSN